MNYYDIKRFSLILSVQTEVEGMKAENMQREIAGDAMVYLAKDFQEKAEELNVLAYKHDHQL